MHAYGHQMACQVVFAPGNILGMGLTDGEAIERLWSLFSKLIGPERASSVRILDLIHYTYAK